MKLRRAMPECGLYHYKVLLFEKAAGRFRQPDEYLRDALATVTTHDMPHLTELLGGTRHRVCAAAVSLPQR